MSHLIDSHIAPPVVERVLNAYLAYLNRLIVGRSVPMGKIGNITQGCQGQERRQWRSFHWSMSKENCATSQRLLAKPYVSTRNVPFLLLCHENDVSK